MNEGPRVDVDAPSGEPVLSLHSFMNECDLASFGVIFIHNVCQQNDFTVQYLTIINTSDSIIISHLKDLIKNIQVTYHIF